MVRWLWTISGLTLLASAAAMANEPSAEESAFFETNIRPVLVDKCYPCHSADAKKLKGDYRLDTRDALRQGGKSGKPAVVPGDLEKSPLLRMIKRHDADLPAMPPKDHDALSAEQVALFEQWIKLGAPDPRVGDPHKPAVAAKPDPKTHWAFQPVKAVQPPDVKTAGWAKSSIDRFILAKLEEKGLTPSKRADKRTLIRRATFDLIGLPPTPAEVEAFLKDESPTAFEKVIDRLLASPHYGERWGRYWLDVARYADTKGYVFEEERRFPYAYTYRDWVVKALNDDMPYDQFLIRQIAADKLENDDKANLAAMGFLTVGRRFLNSQPDIIDDRIDVVSRGTMALTMGCARCHDHKFDPIPTKEYYGFYGVFSSSQEPGELPLIGSVDAASAFQAELKKREEAVQSFLQSKHDELSSKLRSAEGVAAYLTAVHDLANDPDKDGNKLRRFAGSRDLSGFVLGRWQTYLEKSKGAHDSIWAPWHAYAALDSKDFAEKAAEVTKTVVESASGDKRIHPLVAEQFAGKPPTSLKEAAERYGKLLAEFDKVDALPDADQEALRLVLRGPDAPANVSVADAGKLLRRDMQTQLRDLRKKVEEYQVNSPDAPPRAMTLVDVAQPSDARVLVRGNANNPGDLAPRVFPAILTHDKPIALTTGSGRLDLARAIASRDNPLTARVMVNRVWIGHFGVGLVTTPSDFGVRSDPPSHPELLDVLADRFVNEGWSLKKLHREVMLSAAYQQTSDIRPEAAKIDPSNRLVWRMNRRRLDFEATRDSLLAVAGALDPKVGGRPVEITKFSPRRTIYGFIDRQNLPGMFRAFDFASPDTHSPQRFSTVVPQQALFMMNSGFVVDEAKKLAARDDLGPDDNTALRVAKLYELLYSRPPSVEELAFADSFLNGEQSVSKTENGLTAWQKYAQVLLETNEFVYVD